MEIKVDRRIGYLVRALRFKGRVDDARAFARDVQAKVELAEDVTETAKFWGRLLLTPSRKNRRR